MLESPVAKRYVMRFFALLVACSQNHMLGFLGNFGDSEGDPGPLRADFLFLNSRKMPPKKQGKSTWTLFGKLVMWFQDRR